MSIRAVLILTLFIALPADAQQGAPVALKRGQEVRIRERPDVPYRVSDVWTDSIRVRKDGVPSKIIGSADASNFETRYVLGRKRGNTALTGLAIGVLVGAVGGYIAGDDEPGWFAMSKYDKARVLGIVGGVIGIGVGAAAAPKLYSPWTPLSLPTGNSQQE